MATAVHSRPPSTAGLTTSQSQNSAPVFEYRCMFTHDVRKKAKKWHDGSLRFHTFNKRVMVYDDTKNLVGSLHYRSQEDFAEGLELNLDSHVMVQVEEKLSESSTDLTPLLSRQKQDGVDHFVRPDPPTRAILPRINAANSQIKPKSIRELLAGSQGTIGRARLPVISPYQQRYPLSETQPPEPEPEPEPEPKRRKIVAEKENNVVTTQSKQQLTDKRASIVRAQPSSHARIVDISSDDEITLVPRNGGSNTRARPTSPEISEITYLPPKPTGAAKRNIPLPANNEPKRQKKDKPSRTEVPVSRSRGNASKKPSKKPEKVPRESDSNPATPVSASPDFPRRSTADTSVSQIRHPAGPRSSLKFATKKPRPKLMYRALLADSSKAVNDPHSTAATVGSAKDDSSDRRLDNERQIRRPRLTHMIDTDRLFASSQLGIDFTVPAVATEPSGGNLPSDGSPSPGPFDTGTEDIQAAQESDHSSAASSGPEEGNLETVPDSPLFLPQTTSQISPVPSQNLAIDDGHVSFLSQALKPARSKRSMKTTPGATSSTKPSAEVNSPGRSPSPPSSPVFQRRLTADAQSDKSISIPTPSKVQEPNSDAPVPFFGADTSSLPLPPAVPAQAKLFRRVVSENFQPIRRSTEPSTSHVDSVNHTLDASPKSDIHRKSLTNRGKLPRRPPIFSNTIEFRPSSPVRRSPSPPPDLDDYLEQEDVSNANEEISPTAEVTTEYIPAEESGPWTSTEAFLLFDRWPPGRQKPPYAAASRPAATSESGREQNEVTRTRNFSMNSLSKKYGTFGSAKFVSQR